MCIGVCVCVYQTAVFEELQVITASLCSRHRKHTYLETGPLLLTVCVCVGGSAVRARLSGENTSSLLTSQVEFSVCVEQ